MSKQPIEAAKQLVEVLELGYDKKVIDSAYKELKQALSETEKPKRKGNYWWDTEEPQTKQLEADNSVEELSNDYQEEKNWILSHAGQSSLQSMRTFAKQYATQQVEALKKDIEEIFNNTNNWHDYQVQLNEYLTTK